MKTIKVKIPKPSANVEEVTLTGWLKQEGDLVAKGEPLVELTTDKAVFDMASPAAGHILKILAPEQSMLPVGYIIALVGAQGAPLPDVDDVNRQTLAALRGTTAAPVVPKPAPDPASGSVRATPAARRLAREKGLDLHAVARDLGGSLINEKGLTAWLSQNVRPPKKGPSS